MSVVTPPTLNFRFSLAARRIGCFLGIFVGLLIAIFAYALYLQNPHNPILSITIAVIGFLISTIAGLALEKLIDRTWQSIFDQRIVPQRSSQTIEPDFEDVFNVTDSAHFPSTAAIIPVPLAEIHKPIEIGLSRRLVIVGPSGVGKTRQAVELANSIATSAQPTPTCVLTPKRYPIIIPRSIPDSIASQHVILFLDDIYRAYRAASVEDWEFHLSELFSFLEHFCGNNLTIIATLREPDFSKAYYPVSRLWTTFQKIEISLLSQDAEERLINALSKHTEIKVTTSQARELAWVNPGTCTDLINFFLQKHAEGHKEISDKDTAAFKPDYWNKQVFPTMPAVAQTIFRSLAFYREVGLMPSRSMTILLATSIIGGFHPLNILIATRDVRNLVNQGILRVVESSVICHDSFLDGKARTRVDLDKVISLMRSLAHYGPQFLWIWVKMIAWLGNTQKNDFRVEAQYALVQIADFYRTQEPTKVATATRHLEDWVRTNAIAGLLVQTFQKWRGVDTSIAVQGTRKLIKGKSPFSRKAALVLARELGLADVLIKSARDYSHEVRQVGVEQTYLYWTRCAEEGKTSELVTLSHALSNRAILPWLFVPHPLLLGFLVSLTFRLVVKLFGTNNSALIPLLECWQQILKASLFIDSRPAQELRLARKSVRLRLVSWIGSLQLYGILRKVLRPDHIVNLHIIDSWFKLPRNQRLEWCNSLPLTQPDRMGAEAIRPQLIRLAQDPRPLFGVLVIPALATRLNAEFQICVDIVQELFRSDNVEAWAIGLRGLAHGIELGTRKSDQLMVAYKIIEAQVLRMWQERKFREARFETILWPMLIKAWGEQDSGLPSEFALRLANDVGDSASKNSTEERLDLIKGVTGLALNGYPLAALATLEHWYQWDVPVVRQYLIDQLLAIGNIYPGEVRRSLSKPQAPDEVRKAVAPRIEEASTEEERTEATGPLLIALFGDRDLREEWLAALAEDMLNSTRFVEMLYKLIIRAIDLASSERALQLIAHASQETD